MRKIFRPAFLVAAFSVLINTSLWAMDWTIATIATDRWLPNNITLRLDGNQLLLNNTYIYQPGGSSAHGYTLNFSGIWALCGTANGSAVTSDPYLTFVEEHNIIQPYKPKTGLYGEYLTYSDAWTVVGNIQWASDTPVGHSASLLLGNGLSTISLDHTWNFGQNKSVAYQAHTFQVAASPSAPPVPEPSSIIALAGGMTSLFFVRRRKR